jgi:hypothetical protein
MNKDIETIKEVFDKFGIRLILGYGLLLGMYRDGKPLPGDDDVDFLVIDHVDFETKKKIGHMLLDLGFMPQPITVNVFGRMELLEPGYNGDVDSGIIVCERNFKFTIFFFREDPCEKHGREYVCIPKMGAVRLISTPTKFYEKLDKIKVGKVKFFTPYPIKDYLSYSYYDNWRDKSDRRHSPTYPQAHDNI